MNKRRFLEFSIWIFAAIALLLTSEVSSHAEGALVSPEKGDGIHTLLNRYGISGAEAVREFIKLNGDELGINNSLFMGRRYRLPTEAGSVVQSLFGTEHAKVALKDKQLAGAEFYLVSGHGGPDTGAIGRDNGNFLHEDEYAYDVTLRLGRELMSRGAKVHFIIQDRNDGIRDERYLSGNTNERCYPDQLIPENQRARLKQRAEAVNQLYRASGTAYRRCIVLHVDSRSKSQGIDIFFYHHRTSSAGLKMATTMRDTVEAKYRLNQPGRGYTGTVGTRNLFMLNETIPPVVFIELGNIQNERDKERILNPANRQAVANWLAEGALADFRQSPSN